MAENKNLNCINIIFLDRVVNMSVVNKPRKILETEEPLYYSKTFTDIGFQSYLCYLIMIIRYVISVQSLLVIIICSFSLKTASTLTQSLPI